MRTGCCGATCHSRGTPEPGVPSPRVTWCGASWQTAISRRLSFSKTSQAWMNGGRTPSFTTSRMASSGLPTFSALWMTDGRFTGLRQSWSMTGLSMTWRERSSLNCRRSSRAPSASTAFLSSAWKTTPCRRRSHCFSISTQG